MVEQCSGLVCGFGVFFFFRIKNGCENVREMLPYHLDFNFEIKLLLRHPCYLSFLMVPYQNDRSLIFTNR